MLRPARRWHIGLLIGGLGLHVAGCGTASDTVTKPYVMPAYPVRNLPQTKGAPPLPLDPATPQLPETPQVQLKPSPNALERTEEK